MKLHILSEHEGKSLECHICYRKFIYESSLKAHISEVHERSKNPFECDKCNATFARNHNMILHIASEHKGISFECNICCKRFLYESSFKVHISVHERKKWNPSEMWSIWKVMCFSIFYQFMKAQRLTFILKTHAKKGTCVYYLCIATLRLEKAYNRISWMTEKVLSLQHMWILDQWNIKKSC